MGFVSNFIRKITPTFGSKFKKGDFIYVAPYGNCLIIEQVYSISNKGYNNYEKSICYSSAFEVIKSDTSKMMAKYGFHTIIPVWNVNGLYRNLCSK